MPSNYDIYNCHIHTFKKQDVPRRFLPLGIVGVMSTKVGFNFVVKGLRAVNFISKDNAFYKYARFAETGKLPSQEEIFLKCSVQYPTKTKFIILSIDMEYMNAGKVPRKFRDQVDELIALYNKYSDMVIPFIHLDPRRPEMIDLFEHATTNGFKGVKIYPPVGHRIDDERLEPVYNHCNSHGLPVLVHCGPQSPTHYRSSKKKIHKMLDDAGIPYTKKMNKKQLCAQFGHPSLYADILTKYPNMNICFGHWGSEISWKQYLENPSNKENWFYIIREMLENYPNLYTDISFTLNDQEYFSVLKVFLGNEKIRNKVLFGSDYYMVETKSTEKKFGFDLRAYLGEELYKTIAHTNPKNYLNIE